MNPKITWEVFGRSFELSIIILFKTKEEKSINEEWYCLVWLYFYNIKEISVEFGVTNGWQSRSQFKFPHNQ